MSKNALALLALLFVVSSAPAWTWPPSAEVAARADSSLAAHWQADELRAWRDAAGEDGRMALDFLLAWMPPSDLGSWPAEWLIENVELALAERRPEVGDYSFHAFVLPHRMSQEPPQRWRPRLRGLLKDRIAGLALPEAALEVNRFCREWATFKPSSRRDQGPLTTMERGLGRCEEETIFLVSALRSVGIPARQCYTPLWAVSDSNHAWVEAWTGDGWHYLGACEPEACLDRAWFTGPARRAGLVLSAAYGEMPPPPELEGYLYSQGDGATVLNSTGVYNETGWLLVEGPMDESLDQAPWAHVHVFNFGMPLELGRTRMGRPLALGPGNYIVTAEIAGKPWSARAEVKAGETCELRLEAGFPIFDGPVWLRYHRPEDQGGGGCERDDADPAWAGHRERLARHDAEHAARAAVGPEIRGLLDGDPREEEILAALEAAGPGQKAWSEVLLRLDGEARELALELTRRMDVKDFYEVDRSRLEAILAEAASLRAAPDSLYFDSVLSPRLYFQAGTLDWWIDLPRLDGGVDELLAAFRDHVTKAEGTRAGHVATPAQTWRSGVADEASGRACLTGLLRRNGHPAKAERGLRTVEVWEDGAWRELLPWPLNEEDEAPASALPAAYLAIHVTENGLPLDKVETWRQLNLGVFEDGAFRPWYSGQIGEGGGLVEWELPAGDFWLFGGLRNGWGEPRIRSLPFSIAEGDSLELDLEVGIPLSELDRRDLVRREWDPRTRLLLKQRGRSRLLSRFAREGATLVVLGLEAHEPTNRHLGGLIGLELPGLTVVPVSLRGLEGHAPAKGAWTVDRRLAERVFGVKNPARQLPVSVLIAEDGETLLWLEGMRLDLADQLRRVLVDQ